MLELVTENAVLKERNKYLEREKTAFEKEKNLEKLCGLFNY